MAHDHATCPKRQQYIDAYYFPRSENTYADRIADADLEVQVITINVKSRDGYSAISRNANWEIVERGMHSRLSEALRGTGDAVLDACQSVIGWSILPTITLLRDEKKVVATVGGMGIIMTPDGIQSDCGDYDDLSFAMIKICRRLFPLVSAGRKPADGHSITIPDRWAPLPPPTSERR